MSCSEFAVSCSVYENQCLHYSAELDDAVILWSVILNTPESAYILVI